MVGKFEVEPTSNRVMPTSKDVSWVVHTSVGLEGKERVGVGPVGVVAVVPWSTNDKKAYVSGGWGGDSGKAWHRTWSRLRVTPCVRGQNKVPSRCALSDKVARAGFGNQLTYPGDASVGQQRTVHQVQCSHPCAVARQVLHRLVRDGGTALQIDVAQGVSGGWSQGLPQSTS